jgi:hypothetical protein
MKKHGYVSIGLGVFLIVLSGYIFLVSKTATFIPLIIGISLVYMGWRGGKNDSGQNCSSGIYTMRMVSGKDGSSHKLVLMK